MDTKTVAPDATTTQENGEPLPILRNLDYLAERLGVTPATIYKNYRTSDQWPSGVAIFKRVRQSGDAVCGDNHCVVLTENVDRILAAFPPKPPSKQRQLELENERLHAELDRLKAENPDSAVQEVK